MAKPPSIIPLPIRDGYSGTPTRPFRRFQMEDNQYRTIRETSADQFTYSLSWKLDWEQAERFEAWLEYDLGQGVGSFELDFAGKTITVKPSTGMPSYSPMGAKWLVRMEVVELRSPPAITPRTGQLPEWPSELPEFEQEQYTFGKVNAVTKSDIDFGLPDMRVRFQQRTTQFSGTIILNQTQRDKFWEFYKDTLVNGCAWFLAPFVNYLGLNNLKAKFIEQPVETPLSSWYSISLSLDTTKAPIMSYSDYQNTKGFVNDYVEPGYVEDGYVGYYRG